MRRLYLLLGATLFLIFTSTAAQAVVKVEGRYWFPTLSAEIQSTEAALIGDRISLVDDVGLSDSENFPGGRISLELGNHKVRYAYTPLSWDGQKNITRDIDFGGTTYTVSTPVTSSLETDYHRLGYEYDFIDFLGNRLGVIFEIKYFDTKASLTSAGMSAQESLKFPLPAVGVTGQVGLPFLASVGGELTAFTLGSSGYIVDGEVGVNYNPLPLVTLSGGYRFLKIRIEDGDDFGEFELSGPFILVRGGF